MNIITMKPIVDTKAHDVWIVACGGKEPITEFRGQRWQYHWNPARRQHAYYCFDNDTLYDRGPWDI